MNRPHPKHCSCPAHTRERARWTQAVLNSMTGAELALDGRMGRASRSALRSFQEQRGLAPSGMPDGVTLQELARARAQAPSPRWRHRRAARRGRVDGLSGAGLQSELEAGPLLRLGSRGSAVRQLQKQLNANGFDAGAADSIFGPRTHSAVRSFQSARGLAVDGIVGPNTWAALGSDGGSSTPPSGGSGGGAAGRFSVVNTQLPRSGPGFYSYSTSSRSYGLPETIEALQAVGRAWQALHPDAPKLGIGDISKRGGGHFPPHSSHQLGVDVDIRPVRTSGVGRVRYTDPEYSRVRTKALMELLVDNGVIAVRRIGFLDEGITGIGVLAPWKGHDRHMHVRFCIPNEYRGTLEKTRYYTWC